MKKLVNLTVASLGAMVLIGCNNTNNVRYGHITGNLTPEMKGLSERPSDDHTAFAVASNANLRMFWDDVGRTFLLDTPSRLHPYPVIDMSGQGR